MTTRTKPDSMLLQLAAANVVPITASPSERTITGLAVPYGPVGNSSAGPIKFAQGTIALPENIGRIKLLLQHDPERVLGYATSLDDRPDGLYATFYVPESEEGDKALLQAADGRRDGLSAGVYLTAEVIDTILEKMWDGDDSPTDAAGELLEISQVSIPAFRDARTDGSAAAGMSGHITLSVDFGGGNKAAAAAPKKEKHMDPIETPAAPVSAPAPAGVEMAAPAPTALPVAVASEAPVYTFDGRGPSFVRDVFNAKFSYDIEAQARLAKFNSRMEVGDPAQVDVAISAMGVNHLATSAVETRTTLPNMVNQGYRPDLLISAIDKGRPMVSRLGTVPLTDATPFRLPAEGDYTGVGNHTEGTAHVTEGDMTAGEVLFTPTAISGAYRLSRELIEASNPALDVIALRAMLRDYRGAAETKVAAALLAADATATFSVNTVLKLRQELNNFYDVKDEPATFVVAATSYYNTLLADVDSTGRPMLPSINPVNAVGDASPGYTGAHVDGVEIVKSNKITVNDAFIVNKNDILIGESPVRTFRFDEVEGPGIVKLALWAYFGAAVLRATSVVQISSAAT